MSGLHLTTGQHILQRIYDTINYLMNKFAKSVKEVFEFCNQIRGEFSRLQYVDARTFSVTLRF